jgi:aminopeptidase YwaD
MRRCAALCVVALLAGLAPQPLCTQEREDRTLLSWEQMRALINEVSGERQLHTVLELVPYPHIRTRDEYQNQFRETVVMEKGAKAAGYQDVEVESFTTPGSNWYASRGELWLVEPEARKLYDIYDIAISLCTGSETGDVTAEVIDVGSGARPEDYAGRDVQGKIVLGSAGANVLQRLAVFERGAVGVLSYNGLRPDSPDQILSQSIASSGPQGKKPGFGWAVAPRFARDLGQRLAQGTRLRVRSVVRSESFPGEMEVVHATIPGDGSSSQDIMVSAHLYEGYTKQGANDDNSGCATTLEMGRAFIRLMQEGRLPKPKRTIHFLWVPEISGTIAWLNKHPETRKRLIADLNFDMEGLGLASGSSQWVLHRTPDSLPTFLNDLCASVLEFVGQTNRERVRYRHVGYAFTLPVVAPTGSRDPFYYVVDKYYGASDHAIYISQGIPASMFITWPDPYYHSSQDTPDKLDPTMFKRAAVVGAAAMTVLSTAEDVQAAKVTAEALARGSERMAENQRKGLSYLADAAPGGEALLAAYKEALAAVRHQTSIEKAVVRSSAVLYSDPDSAEKRLADFDPSIEQKSAALLAEVKRVYQMQAQLRSVSPVDPVPTDAEVKAARTLVEGVGGGGGMFGGGRRGVGGQETERLSPEDRAATQKIPPHMSSELGVLLGRKKTVMEIRDFLSGEFEPLALSALADYLRVQEKLGRVKLTQIAEEPRPAQAPGKPKPPAKKAPKER